MSQVLLLLWRRWSGFRLPLTPLQAEAAAAGSFSAHLFPNLVPAASGHLRGHLGPCGADPRPPGDGVLPEALVLLRQHYCGHQVGVIPRLQSVRWLENINGRRSPSLSWCSATIHSQEKKQELKVTTDRQIEPQCYISFALVIHLLA